MSTRVECSCRSWLFSPVLAYGLKAPAKLFELAIVLAAYLR
jgi:hypothetical protein